MTDVLASAPVLSTPDTHILTETEPTQGLEQSSTLSEEQFVIRYEIERTIQEIRYHKWRRVALQFPDQMLPHSSRVYETLSHRLSSSTSNQTTTPDNPSEESLSVKLTILADTSYGSCCVDEIAAEHVDAEAVVHYGRACLSPTARLPVLHIYTRREMDQKAAISAFIGAFPDRTTKAILTGDIPYASHIEEMGHRLREAGYTQTFPAEIIHDPSSLIPNRTLPAEVNDVSQLGEWVLFHVAEPPTSLLLTLSSMMKSIHIYNPPEMGMSAAGTPSAHEAKTAIILRRRYALVTSMATVSTWGILINTLSVRNYLDVLEKVKKQIAGAGKKSYLFVVGKLNAAKVANFAEIGGWVVIGCWESSLIDSRDFFKPILTPFELGLALASDDSRIWTGAWRSDFAGVLSVAESNSQDLGSAGIADEDVEHAQDLDSEEESAPPEFDLRTGRYVTRTRPMITPSGHTSNGIETSKESKALTKRANGDVISVNGVASPAAEYLKEKRTWKGLGSDFEVKYEDQEQEGSPIEEGRTGVARGYTVGDSLRV